MSIIRDPVFSTKGVEGTIVQLRKRFAEAFQPVFKSEEGRFQLYLSLRKVIHAAVLLRAEMLVEEHDYEVIWTRAGSLFSRDEMEKCRGIHSSTSGTVKLPRCPGFRRIPKIEATIDYAGLTTAAMGTPEAKCVAKALVC